MSDRPEAWAPRSDPAKVPAPADTGDEVALEPVVERIGAAPSTRVGWAIAIVGAAGGPVGLALIGAFIYMRAGDAGPSEAAASAPSASSPAASAETGPGGSVPAPSATIDEAGTAGPSDEAAPEAPGQPSRAAGEGGDSQAGALAPHEDPLLELGAAPSWVDAMSRRRRIERARESVDHARRLHRHGRYEGAETWLRRAYHLRPDHSVAPSLLAMNLQERGRDEQALAWARLGAELTPKLAAPYYILGRIHERAGDLEAARNAFQKAIERNPDERRAQRRLRFLDRLSP